MKLKLKLKINLMRTLLIALTFILSQLAQAQIFSDSKPEKHKGAADGLIRIDKNGQYIYNQKEKSFNQSSHFRLGTTTNPDVSTEICNQDASNCQVVDYEDIYQGSNGVGFEYDYEYFLFSQNPLKIGKIGLQAGLSLNVAQGKGRLVNNPQQESIETFTFVTLPLFLGAIYRLQYFDRQILVPYASAGGVYAVLAEKREDRSKVNAIGSFGFYGSGGVLLSLAALDRELGQEFETEYEISNLWLSVEFKYLSVQSEAFELSNGYVQGGIGFDF